MDSMTCKQCSGEMKKGKRAEKSMGLQVLGVFVFLFAFGLLFLFPIGTVFGAILMLVAMNLGYSQKKVWKCGDCGFFFERD